MQNTIVKAMVPEKTVAEGNAASMYYVKEYDYDHYPM